MQGFSVQREHDHAHGVRLGLACLRANVGDWTIQSQARDYSGFRLVIHQKSDYIPIPVYLEMANRTCILNPDYHSGGLVQIESALTV